MWVSVSVSLLSCCISELWDSVVCKVVSGRSRLGLPSLPSGSVSAVRLFGLQDAMVTRLVEQLPKAENCSQYNFKYFKPSKMSQWDRVKKVCEECRVTQRA